MVYRTIRVDQRNVLIIEVQTSVVFNFCSCEYMASVAENTGEDQENQTILNQSLDLGNEALDEIKQKAKP